MRLADQKQLAMTGWALAFLLITSPALAYTGPGAGITIIGSLLALVAALVLGIVGFVWYPLKRLLKSRKKADATKATQAAG